MEAVRPSSCFVARRLVAGDDTERKATKHEGIVRRDLKPNPVIMVRDLFVALVLLNLWE